MPDVKGPFGRMAVDLVRNRLFIPAEESNTVVVVDMGEKKISRRLEGLTGPRSVIHLPGIDMIAVSCAGDGKVHVLDGSGLTETRSVEIGKDPGAMVFDPSSRLIYVGYAKPAIALFDPTDGKRGKNIELVAVPEMLCMEHEGKRLFANVPIVLHVAVIDREKNLPTTTWLVRGARGNRALALDELHQRLFVGCREPGAVVVLDSTSGKAIAKIDVGKDCDSVWHDPVGSRLYASSGDGTISIIRQDSPDKYERIAQTSTAKGAGSSFWVKETRTIYVPIPGEDGKPAELRAYKVAP